MAGATNPDHRQNRTVAITPKLNRLIFLMTRYYGYKTKGTYIQELVAKDTLARAYGLQDMPEDTYNEVMKLAQDIQGHYKAIELNRVKQLQKNIEKGRAARWKKQERARKDINKIRAKYGYKEI